MSSEEVPLDGGNVAGSVTRVGDTVRKPVTASTPAVAHLLGFLAERGFDGSPRWLGEDDVGRQVVEHVPGTVVHDRGLLAADDLVRVGRLVRALHDLTATYEAPRWARWDVALRAPRADLVGHGDLAPWNLVSTPDRHVFIDWDGAGPTTRAWELAYAAHGFVGLAADGDPAVDAVRLAALAEGYRPDRWTREELADDLVGPVRAMHRLLVASASTGAQPWARLHAEGHASHWGPAADYVERHGARWRRALGVG